MNKVLNIYSMGIRTIHRFLILQLYWLGFTLLGLVLFGVFPATYALLKTIKKPNDLKAREYFHIFKKVYKENFFKLNQAAIVWQVMFVLMGMNLLIFHDGNIYIYLAVLGMILMMVLCVFHFLQYFKIDRSIIEQVKRSFGYVFLHPRQNVLYMCILFGLILAINFSPGITFFFGSSVAAHFIVKS